MHHKAALEAVLRASTRQPVVVVEAPRGRSWDKLVTALLHHNTYQRHINLAEHANITLRDTVELLEQAGHGTILTATHTNEHVWPALDRVRQLHRAGHFLLVGFPHSGSAGSGIKPIPLLPSSIAERTQANLGFLTSLLTCDPDTSVETAEFGSTNWPHYDNLEGWMTLTATGERVLAALDGAGQELDCVADKVSARRIDLLAELATLERSRALTVIPSWREDGGWILPHAPRRRSSREGLRDIAAYELICQATASPTRIEFAALPASRYHGAVDLIVSEAGESDKVWIQISEETDWRKIDTASLDTCRRRWPASYRRGIVLYCGSRTVRLNDAVHAVPITAMWHSNAAVTRISAAGLDDELEALAAQLRSELGMSAAAPLELGKLQRWLDAAAAKPLGKVAASLAGLGMACEVVAAHSSCDASGRQGVSVGFDATVRNINIEGRVSVTMDGRTTFWSNCLSVDGISVSDSSVKAKLIWQDRLDSYSSILDRIIADLVAQVPGALKAMLQPARL